MSEEWFYVLFVAIFLGPAFGMGFLLGRRMWTRPEIPLRLDALDMVHADGKRCILRWVHVEKDKTLTVCRKFHY
jgi:hypothetical protein